MENNNISNKVQGNPEARKHDGGIGAENLRDRQTAQARGFTVELRKDVAGRPCAVIEPESIGQTYIRKDSIGRAWNSSNNVEATGSCYVPSYYPSGNISPRQSFQENMSRIVVPSPSELNSYHDINNYSKSNTSKYAEGPILVKSAPHVEMMFRPPFYPPAPSTVEYQRYAEYASPRLQVIKDSQMYSKSPEQNPYFVSTSSNYPCRAYARVNSTRYEPYSQIKDKYIQQTPRYDYPYQYPAEVTPLMAIDKFTQVKKRLAQTSEFPLGYLQPTSHAAVQSVETHNKVPPAVPVRRGQRPPIVPHYPQPAPGLQVDSFNPSHSRTHGYIGAQKNNAQINFNARPLQDNRSSQNHYAQCSNVPYQDPRLSGEPCHNQNYSKNLASPPSINYVPYSTSSIPAYHKPFDVPLYNEKPTEFDPAYYRYYQKHPNQASVAYNPLENVPTQFSPNIISPAESSASCNSITTLPPQSMEDGGYVSQCSTSSGRSSDLNAGNVSKTQIPEPSVNSQGILEASNSKPDASIKNDKQKSSLDLRQYYSTWAEELDDPPKSHETPKSSENVPIGDFTSNVTDVDVPPVPSHNACELEKVVSAVPPRVNLPNTQYVVYSQGKPVVSGPAYSSYSAANINNMPAPPYVGKHVNAPASPHVPHPAARPLYAAYPTNTPNMHPHSYRPYPTNNSSPQHNSLRTADSLQPPVSQHKTNVPYPSYGAKFNVSSCNMQSMEKPQVPVQSYTPLVPKPSCARTVENRIHSTQDYQGFNQNEPRVDNSEYMRRYNSRNNLTPERNSYCNKSTSVVDPKPNSFEMPNCNELVDVEANISQSIIHKDVVMHHGNKPIEMKIEIAPGYNPNFTSNSKSQSDDVSPMSTNTITSIPNHTNYHTVVKNNADLESCENSAAHNQKVQNHNRQKIFEPISQYAAQAKQKVPKNNNGFSKIKQNGQVSKTLVDSQGQSDERNKNVFHENVSFVHPTPPFYNFTYNQPSSKTANINTTYDVNVNTHSSNVTATTNYTLEKPSARNDKSMKRKCEDDRENHSKEKLFKERNELNTKPVHESVLKYVSATNVQHSLMDLSHSKSVADTPKLQDKSDIEAEIGFAIISTDNNSETTKKPLEVNDFNVENIADAPKGLNQMNPSMEASYRFIEERLSTTNSCSTDRTKSLNESKTDKKQDFIIRHSSGNAIKHNIDNIILTSNVDVANSDYRYNQSLYTNDFESQIVATDLSMVKNYDNFEYIPKAQKTSTKVTKVDTPLRTPEIEGERLQEMGFGSLNSKIEKSSDLRNDEKMRNNENNSPTEKTDELIIKTAVDISHPDLKNFEKSNNAANVDNLVFIYDKPKMGNIIQPENLISDKNNGGNDVIEKYGNSIPSINIELNPVSPKIQYETRESVTHESNCVVDVSSGQNVPTNVTCLKYETPDDTVSNKVNVICFDANSELSNTNNDIKDKLDTVKDGQNENINTEGNNNDSLEANVQPTLAEIRSIADENSLPSLSNIYANSHSMDKSIEISTLADTDDDEGCRLSSNDDGRELPLYDDIKKVATPNSNELGADSEEGMSSKTSTENNNDIALTESPMGQQKLKDVQSSSEYHKIQNVQHSSDHCEGERIQHPDYSDHHEVESIQYSDYSEHHEEESIKHSDDSNEIQNSQHSTNHSEIKGVQPSPDNFVIENVEHSIEDRDLKNSQYSSENIHFSANKNEIEKRHSIDLQNNIECKASSVNNVSIEYVEQSNETKTIHHTQDPNEAENMQHSTDDHDTESNECCVDHNEMETSYSEIDQYSTGRYLKDVKHSINHNKTEGSQYNSDCNEMEAVYSKEHSETEIIERSNNSYENNNDLNSIDCQETENIQHSVDCPLTECNENSNLKDVISECRTQEVSSEVNNSDVNVLSPNTQDAEAIQTLIDVDKSDNMDLEIDNVNSAAIQSDDDESNNNCKDSKELPHEVDMVCEDQDKDLIPNECVESPNLNLDRSVDIDSKQIESCEEKNIVSNDNLCDDAVTSVAIEDTSESKKQDSAFEEPTTVLPEHVNSLISVMASTQLLHVDKLEENDETISFEVDNDAIKSHIESQYHSFQLAIDPELTSSDGNVFYCQIESPTTLKGDENDEEKYYLQVDSLAAAEDVGQVMMVPYDGRDVGHMQDDSCVPWIEDVACVETVISEGVTCEEGEQSREVYTPEPLWGLKSSSPEDIITKDVSLSPHSENQSTLNSVDVDYAALISNDTIEEAGENAISDNEFESLSMAMSNEDHSISNFSESVLKTAVNLEPPKCCYDQELINVLMGDSDGEKGRVSDDEDCSLASLLETSDNSDNYHSNVKKSNTTVLYVPNKTMKPFDNDSDDSTSSSDSTSDTSTSSDEEYHKNDSPVCLSKLITKGAKKYIPPIDISDHNVKCQLVLPEEKLLALKKDLEYKLNPEVLHKNKKIVKVESKETSIAPKPGTSVCIPKPKLQFDEVLRDIDESNLTWCKIKLQKQKMFLPKMIIKKSGKGSFTTKFEETKPNDTNAIGVQSETKDVNGNISKVPVSIRWETNHNQTDKKYDNGTHKKTSRWNSSSDDVHPDQIHANLDQKPSVKVSRGRTTNINFNCRSYNLRSESNERNNVTNYEEDSKSVSKICSRRNTVAIDVDRSDSRKKVENNVEKDQDKKSRQKLTNVKKTVDSRIVPKKISQRRNTVSHNSNLDEPASDNSVQQKGNIFNISKLRPHTALDIEEKCKSDSNAPKSIKDLPKINHRRKSFVSDGLSNDLFSVDGKKVDDSNSNSSDHSDIFNKPTSAKYKSDRYKGESSKKQDGETRKGNNCQETFVVKPNKGTVQRRMSICYTPEPEIKDDSRLNTTTQHPKKIPQRRMTVCYDVDTTKLRDKQDWNDLCSNNRYGVLNNNDEASVSNENSSYERHSNKYSYNDSRHNKDSRAPGKIQQRRFTTFHESKAYYKPRSSTKDKWKYEKGYGDTHGNLSVPKSCDPRSNSSFYNQTNVARNRMNQRSPSVSYESNFNLTKKSLYEPSHRKILSSCDPEPYIPQKVVKRGRDDNEIGRPSFYYNPMPRQSKNDLWNESDVYRSQRRMPRRQTISYDRNPYFDSVVAKRGWDGRSGDECIKADKYNGYMPDAKEPRNRTKPADQGFTLSKDKSMEGNLNKIVNKVNQRRMTFDGGKINVNNKMLNPSGCFKTSLDFSANKWQPYVRLSKNNIVEEMIRQKKSGVSFFGSYTRCSSRLDSKDEFDNDSISETEGRGKDDESGIDSAVDITDL